jgi:hypothetical protein
MPRHLAWSCPTASRVSCESSKNSDANGPCAPTSDRKRADCIPLPLSPVPRLRRARRVATCTNLIETRVHAGVERAPIWRAEVLWRLRNLQLASGVRVCRIFTRLVADLLRFTAGYRCCERISRRLRLVARAYPSSRSRAAKPVKTFLRYRTRRRSSRNTISTPRNDV